MTRLARLLLLTPELLLPAVFALCRCFASFSPQLLRILQRAARCDDAAWAPEGRKTEGGGAEVSEIWDAKQEKMPAC